MPAMSWGRCRAGQALAIHKGSVQRDLAQEVLFRVARLQLDRQLIEQLALFVVENFLRDVD